MVVGESEYWKQWWFLKECFNHAHHLQIQMFFMSIATKATFWGFLPGLDHGPRSPAHISPSFVLPAISPWSRYSSLSASVSSSGTWEVHRKVLSLSPVLQLIASQLSVLTPVPSLCLVCPLSCPPPFPLDLISEVLPLVACLPFFLACSPISSLALWKCLYPSMLRDSTIFLGRSQHEGLDSARD